MTDAKDIPVMSDSKLLYKICTTTQLISTLPAGETKRRACTIHKKMINEALRRMKGEDHGKIN